jgi:hypothetical protein
MNPPIITSSVDEGCPTEPHVLADQQGQEDEGNLAGTGHLEALSDGVFAIIITLPVLGVHRPEAARGHPRPADRRDLSRRLIHW